MLMPLPTRYGEGDTTARARERSGEGGDGRSGRLRLGLVFPVLPPTLDGIGDHTARLAGALAERTEVTVYTAQRQCDAIAGVTVRTAFDVQPPSAVRDLVRAVEADPPDALIVQFNQFSYGRWGLNPFLPLAVRAIRQRCPGIRIVWVAHEDFVPATNWRFAVMTTWQRAQFLALGRLADVVFFSIEPWVRKYAPWFAHALVEHLPIGSNIEVCPLSRDAARAALDIPPSTFVAGVFGTVSASRLLPLIRAACERIAQSVPDFLLLYVGSEGERLRGALQGVPVRDAGRLPAAEVALHFKAMDLHLCPYVDGVSTRRGSFMAGLQQGVPSLTNLGVHTDPVLQSSAGHAFAATEGACRQAYEEAAAVLAHDPTLRSRLGEAGRILYESAFTFTGAADRVVDAVTKVVGMPR